MLTPGQFTEEYAKVMKDSSPDIQIEIVRNLQLKIVSRVGKESSAFLDNAYDEYKQDPTKLTDVIHKFAAASLTASASASEAIDASRIVPVIKDRPWLEETKQALLSRGAKELPQQVYEDFNDDLIIVYAQDSPENIRYLNEKDLIEANIERKNLRSLACENLKNLLPKIECQGGNGTYMLTAGGSYEASLLLLDKIWSDGQIQVKGDIVVAIPTRDLLMVTGSEDSDGLARVRDLVNQVQAEGSYRLTKKLFIYRNGKFSEFK